MATVESPYLRSRISTRRMIVTCQRRWFQAKKPLAQGIRQIRCPERKEVVGTTLAFPTNPPTATVKWSKRTDHKSQERMFTSRHNPSAPSQHIHAIQNWIQTASTAKKIWVVITASEMELFKIFRETEARSILDRRVSTLPNSNYQITCAYQIG